MKVLLVEDRKYDQFFPIATTRFLWDITCGIFNSLERAKNVFSKVIVDSSRFNIYPYSLLKEQFVSESSEINMILNARYIFTEKWNPGMKKIGISKDGDFIYLKDVSVDQENIELIKNGDWEYLKNSFAIEEIKSGFMLNGIEDIIKLNSQVIVEDSRFMKNNTNFISPQDNIYIAKDAFIQQNVSLQATNGPIIIDNEATVRSFSLIDGPAYIGKKTVIDSAKVREGTTIKDVCKIGGEIEESIMENFSNKHHEGFVGHSYIGKWVNIGAIATTSDLKNNYGNISIQIEDKVIDTKTNKFGSIIGDWVKIGIGMMLNTGTVIGTGANLFQEYALLPKYISAFSWGMKSRYEVNRFIKDLSNIMSRRKQSLSENEEKFISEIYKNITED